MCALTVPVLPDPLATTKMPWPLVLLTWLPLMVVVNVPLSVVAKLSVVRPTPIPAADTALLALIQLLLMVDDTVDGPNAVSSITTPSMFLIGASEVPLFEMLKLPVPVPLTPPVRSGPADCRCRHCRRPSGCR